MGMKENLKRARELDRELNETRQYFRTLLNMAEELEMDSAKVVKSRRLDPTNLKKLMKIFQKLSAPSPDDNAFIENILRTLFPDEMCEYDKGKEAERDGTVGISLSPYNVINFTEIARKIVATISRHILTDNMDSLTEKANFGEEIRKQRSDFGQRGGKARIDAIEAERIRWLKTAHDIKKRDASLSTRSIAMTVLRKLNMPKQRFRSVYNVLRKK